MCRVSDSQWVYQNIPFFGISRFLKNRKRRPSLNVYHIFPIRGKPNFIDDIEAIINPLYCDIWHITECRVSDLPYQLVNCLVLGSAKSSWNGYL